VIHLIHGIHYEPSSPVTGLIPYLEAAGFDVAYPNYGFELALETRIVNPMLQGSLLPYIRPGDVLIGHSNGCAIAYELMMAGAPAIGAVFINGALQTTIARPGSCKWIDVYYNPGDDITIAARLAADIGIVSPVWGELGHSGYAGNDPDIRDFNCGSSTAMPVVSGHSDFFTPAKLSAWGPFLAGRLQSAIGSDKCASRSA
jgi:hypothetical protein